MVKPITWSAPEFLRDVQKLADEGLSRRELVTRLGLKNDSTLVFRLVRASQQTGKAIPAFGRRVKNRRIIPASNFSQEQRNTGPRPPRLIKRRAGAR